MAMTKDMSLAEALADLTPEQANVVILVADALRRRSAAVKPVAKAKKTKAASASAPVAGKKRGRPKGSKNTVKPAEEVQEELPLAEEEVSH